MKKWMKEVYVLTWKQYWIIVGCIVAMWVVLMSIGLYITLKGG